VEGFGRGLVVRSGVGQVALCPAGFRPDVQRRRALLTRQRARFGHRRLGQAFGFGRVASAQCRECFGDRQLL
jgi:hypothetical protein